MNLSRKQFLATAALGMAGAAVTSAQTTSLAPPAPKSSDCAPAPQPGLHFHILRPDEYNHAAMMQTAQASHPHKQVFVTSALEEIRPGLASLYLHMQNSLNAFQFSMSGGPGSLGTLGVLMGSAVLLALNDAMWGKYPFGPSLKLHEANGMPALRNVYYHATSKLDPKAAADDTAGMYQDWSAQAVLARGGKFWVCHNALTGASHQFAGKMKLNPDEVLAEWKKNFLPGYQWIPAGVGGAQLAQDNGWKLFVV